MSHVSTKQAVRRMRLQFTLGTLLLGMFVFAVFFGSSGLWYRRVTEQRANSAAQIDQLRASLETERRAHRETQARLMVAETQLKDAVGVQLGEQQTGREAAERKQQELAVLAERLQLENVRALQEIENLRRELQSMHEGKP